MASPPEPSGSPSSPGRAQSSKRQSIIGYFNNLNMDDDKEGEPASEASSAAGTNQSSNKSTCTQTSSTRKSLLRGTFRRSWGPRTAKEGRGKSRAPITTIAPGGGNLTLRISDLYRAYGDNWSINLNVKDQPTDVSTEIATVARIIEKTRETLSKLTHGEDDIAEHLLQEMAEAVYASNAKARKGTELDITIKLCMAIFQGNGIVEYTDRTDEYQARLEKLVRENVPPGEHQVIRTRREVVQHAAAFQHIIDAFVRREQAMSEQLIQVTHAILVRGASGDAAGVFGTKEFGGIYRSKDAWVGTTRFPRPREIPSAMASLVKKLQARIDEAEKTGELDPFALAAEYGDRFVNIHPFQDGNGRMCRLILNAILVKYAGIIVNLGESGQERDEYIQTARESREVGGHAGALATQGLRSAVSSYRRVRNAVRGKAR